MEEIDPQKPAEERDVQSVRRALDILESVASGGELGVTDIARALSLHVATTHNILRTLSRYEYLENRGGRYRIGHAVARLLPLNTDLQGLPELLKPWMQRISRECGEAASSSVLSGHVLRILAFEPGTHPVTIHFPQWVWPQPLCLATGRLLVANRPEDEWPLYIADGARAEPKWTEYDWPEYLRGVRDVGFCVIRHGGDGGQLAMGFPIRSRAGVILLAIGASAPVFRATDALCARMFRTVRQAAYELSEQFGCPEELLREIAAAEEPDWSAWGF